MPVSSTVAPRVWAPHLQSISGALAIVRINCKTSSPFAIGQDDVLCSRVYNLNYRVIAIWHESPAQFSYRAPTEQSIRHDGMRCGSASSSTNPTVRRGQSIICLPLAYYMQCGSRDTSTVVPTLHQIRCRPSDLHQVCSVHTVQSNGGPGCLRQSTSTTP